MRHEQQQGGEFFKSHRWPLLTILAYTAISAIAFTPRLIDYLTEGHWGLSATRAFEFAPNALNTHALFGMALIPLFLLQPIIGTRLMSRKSPKAARLIHRWHGRFLVVATTILSILGFYITYAFAANSDSITSVIFMFLVALMVIIFFIQAVIEARKHRIALHLDSIVFGMIFLSVPATGRLIEALMRSFGVVNARSKDLVSIGFGFQVELVDITILVISAVPLILWSFYALPRCVYRSQPVKLMIAVAFFGLPFIAVAAQTLLR